VFDAGTHSRFFLVPKASRADREPVLGKLPKRVSYRHNADGRDMTNPRNAMGDAERRRVERGEPGISPRANTHPTVKPVRLMRHLVRLVTPPGGLVLDPFLGSGTTALAAEAEGFRWVGIELDPESVAIAEARLDGWQRGLGLADEVPA
jgi:site-specific DNA-methyltransferase (adenine-specific)